MNGLISFAQFLFRYFSSLNNTVLDVVYRNMESIKGKKILLVGATGGIGSRLAKLLIGSGADLFITGRSQDKLKKVAAAINLPEEKFISCDITDSNAVARLNQRYFQSNQKIDILINASGIGIIKPFEELTEEEFLRSVNTNLFGAWLLMRSFMPSMKEAQKGLVINVPGVLGKVPMAGAAAYSATKYGLVGMTQSIREEIKRTDIRITNLFLGGVDSAFWDTINLRVQRDKMIMADEAAKAIWFLCQQPSSGVISEMVLQPFNHQAI